MPRRIDIVLEDILAAIDGIEGSVGRKAFAAFQMDWLLQRGVERGIEIVSEAVRHIPDEVLATRPEIEWRKVRGIGNRIRHEYHQVSPQIVWEVVTDDLPALRAAIAAMLQTVRR